MIMMTIMIQRKPRRNLVSAGDEMGYKYCVNILWLDARPAASSNWMLGSIDDSVILKTKGSTETLIFFSEASSP